MSPEHKIRIDLRLQMDKLGYPVFNFTPDGKGEFPKIHIGEQFKQNERFTIDRLSGSTQITIHVWHNNLLEEGTVMKVIGEIEEVVLREYGVKGEDISTSLLLDDSTDVRMLHGIVEINIKY